MSIDTVVYRPSIPGMLFRGMFKLCPRCGSGGLFEGWFKMKERCPRCELPLAREEAHFVGAMAINLVVTEILFFGLLIVWAIASWPHPPWTTITITGITLNIVVPILFYPFAKTLWTAIDLILHRFDPVDRMTIELP